MKKPPSSVLQFILPGLDEKQSYSNTVELYDIMPKYYYGKIKKEKNSSAIKRYFKYRGSKYSITITPATLFDTEDKQKLCYPSSREEIVEDAIRKIAIEKESIRIVAGQIGVNLTIHDIRKELKKRGHSFNWNEIKESLAVSSKTNIEIKSLENNSITISSPIFPTLVYEDKKESDSNIFVSFHLLVSKSIKEDKYRLVNYRQFMKYKKSLARWLHKRISHIFIQAELDNPYTIKLSTIVRDSGMSEYKQISDSLKQVRKSIDEMVELKTIKKYEEKKIFDTGRKNKIIDVLFSLWLSEEFCGDIKKGNYFKSNNISKPTSTEKPRLISNNLIKEVLKKSLNSSEYNLPTKFISSYLLDVKTQKQIDNSLLSIKAAKEYILKLEQEKKVASSSKARIIKKALSEGWKPETQESAEENNKTETIPEDTRIWHKSSTPEHQESFDQFLDLIKEKVGEDSYSSWFSINLDKIGEEEIFLEVKSNFLIQELTNQYGDLISEISLKIFKKKYFKMRVLSDKDLSKNQKVA